MSSLTPKQEADRLKAVQRVAELILARLKGTDAWLSSAAPSESFRPLDVFDAQILALEPAAWRFKLLRRWAEEGLLIRTVIPGPDGQNSRRASRYSVPAGYGPRFQEIADDAFAAGPYIAAYAAVGGGASYEIEDDGSGSGSDVDVDPETGAGMPFDLLGGSPTAVGSGTDTEVGMIAGHLGRMVEVLEGALARVAKVEERVAGVEGQVVTVLGQVGEIHGRVAGAQEQMSAVHREVAGNREEQRSQNDFLLSMSETLGRLEGNVESLSLRLAEPAVASDPLAPDSGSALAEVEEHTDLVGSMLDEKFADFIEDFGENRMKDLNAIQDSLVANQKLFRDRVNEAMTSRDKDVTECLTILSARVDTLTEALNQSTDHVGNLVRSLNMVGDIASKLESVLDRAEEAADRASDYHDLARLIHEFMVEIGAMPRDVSPTSQKGKSLLKTMYSSSRATIPLVFNQTPPDTKKGGG